MNVACETDPLIVTTRNDTYHFVLNSYDHSFRRIYTHES